MTDQALLDSINRRCGEDYNGFYDRDGEYFRAGVDPRNYYGRFLPATWTKWVKRG